MDNFLKGVDKPLIVGLATLSLLNALMMYSEVESMYLALMTGLFTFVILVFWVAIMENQDLLKEHDKIFVRKEENDVLSQFNERRQEILAMLNDVDDTLNKALKDDTTTNSNDDMSSSG